MSVDLVPIGGGVKGWRCPKHDLASANPGWACPRCVGRVAIDAPEWGPEFSRKPAASARRRSRIDGLIIPESFVDDVEKAARRHLGGRSRRAVCALGHSHDSKGEAGACPGVYARAKADVLTVFIPGRPGIPCFRLPPDDSGRPVYASVDWVLCDSGGAVVLGLDWKGKKSHRSVFKHGDGFARTKRIFEAATGAKVIEVNDLEGVAAALATLGGPRR